MRIKFLQEICTGDTWRQHCMSHICELKRYESATASHGKRRLSDGDEASCWTQTQVLHPICCACVRWAERGKEGAEIDVAE